MRRVFFLALLALGGCDQCVACLGSVDRSLKETQHDMERDGRAGPGTPTMSVVVPHEIMKGDRSGKALVKISNNGKRPFGPVRVTCDARYNGTPVASADGWTTKQKFEEGDFEMMEVLIDLHDMRANGIQCRLRD